MNKSTAKSNIIKLPEWRTLLEVALTWEFGSRHSHEEIARIIGLVPGTSLYRTAISRANTELRERGKMLRSIRGAGYETVKPDDYSEAAVNFFNSGKRRIVVGLEVLKGAPVEQMSSKARERHSLVTDRAAQLVSLLQGGCSEVKRIACSGFEVNRD